MAPLNAYAQWGARKVEAMANTKSRSNSDEVVEVGLAKDLVDLFRVGETKNLKLRIAKSGTAIQRNINGSVYANVEMDDPESGEVIYGTAYARGNVRLDMTLNMAVADGATKRIPVTRVDADGPLAVLPKELR